MVGDRRLNEIYGLVALRALLALELRAHEVLVGAAIAAMATVDQLALACPTPNRALQVVPMLAVALAGMSVRYEDRLNSVEELLADKRLVPAVVGTALVRDQTDVIGVREELVDPRNAQGRRVAAAGCPRAQAASLEQVRDVRHAVQTRGIGLVCPLDHWAPLGVDDDGPHLASLRERLA